MSERALHFDTLQVHAGQVPDPATGACAVPIYQTTSFVFKNFEQAKAISSVEEFGFDYTRITNPTNEVLENRIALLEGGSGALSVASGSAATAYSILNITHTGDEIVAAKTLYGGSFNLFQNTLPKHGVKTHFVDPADPENFRKVMNERTKAIFVETIGNPEINIIDFEKLNFTMPYMAYDLPAQGRRLVQQAIGYDATFVAGTQIVDADQFTGALPGKLVRGPR